MNKTPALVDSALIATLHGHELFRDIPEGRLSMVLEKASSAEIYAGDLLFDEGELYHKGIYILVKGSISLGQGDLEYVTLGAGDVVGLTTFVGKSAYTVRAKAVTDASLVYFPEICIYKLMADFEHFRRRFYQMTLKRLNVTSQDSALSLSSNTYKAVGSHMTSPVISVPSRTPVLEASAVMSRHRIGALIITDESGDVSGLITTKHVVHEYLPMLAERGADVTAEEIMDKHPTVIPVEYPLIEALAEMQGKRKDYAVVARSGKPLGIISNKDIMRIIYHNTSTMSAQVDRARTFEDLKEMKDELFSVAKELVNNSRLTSEVLKTISSLHLGIQKQVHQLTLEAYRTKTGVDIKEIDHCLMIMGSGARREMMLDPDQDNGFIFGNNITPDERAHLMAFGADFSDNLELVGYKKCPGNIMTTNPEMSKTLTRWKEDVYGMVFNPGTTGLTWSSIIFDLDGFFGNDSLVWELKAFILKITAKNDLFLLQMFSKEANTSVPLSLFGKFSTIKEGENKGMLDLKSFGLGILVFIARLNTLKHGLNDLNTIDRIKHLQRIHVVDDATAGTILSAYEVIADITFREQIRKAENNEPMNKMVDPKKLSAYNQLKLKDALHEISRFHADAKKIFRSPV